MQFLQNSPSFTRRVQALVSDSNGLEFLKQESLPIDQRQNFSKMSVFFRSAQLLPEELFKGSELSVSNKRGVQTYFKLCEQSREAIMIMVPGTPRKWIDGPASFFEQEFPSSFSYRTSWSWYASQCPRMAHRLVCIGMITSTAAEPCRSPLLNGSFPIYSVGKW